MKTAISIPNNVFEQAESLARKLKVSRSELYTEAVKVYLKENHVEDVTAKLNEVYENAASNLDNNLFKVQMTSLPKEEW
jgi:metal-responsive CopG/Arc/MetJ family transcriptional regulator